MNVSIKRFKAIVRRYRAKNMRSSRPSFSECGEDLIIMTLMDMMQLRDWTFVDLGANHPIRSNNFYLHFLCNKASGINIEPNPNMFKYLMKGRKRDVNIPAAVTAGTGKGEIGFFLNENNLISSLAPNTKSVQIKVKTFSTVELALITKKFSIPWVLGIDIEGSDFQILFDLVRLGIEPDLIVLETFQGIQGINPRIESMNTFLTADYALVAMTPLNNFYARKSSWIFERA